MNIYIPLALLVALLCFIFRANEIKAKRALWITMMIACAVLAVRYEFGPDYFNYRAIFEGIHGSDIEGYTGAGSFSEKAFLYFFAFFPSYTAFVVFVTIALFIVNTVFIVKYANPKYYWFAVLFMFIEPTFLLMELAALRAALAAILFIIGFGFLLRGKRLVYVALIVLATMLHTSSFVLLIFALFNKNRTSFLLAGWLPFVCLALALLSVATGSNFIVDRLVDFAMDSVEELSRYEGYKETVGKIGQSIFTLLFKAMTFTILYYLVKAGQKERDSQYILIFKVAIVASIIQLILGQSLIGDRYLMFFNIIYICAIIRSINTKQIIDSKIILLIIAVISIYILYSKMGKDYNSSLLIYRTIFDAPYIP